MFILAILVATLNLYAPPAIKYLSTAPTAAWTHNIYVCPVDDEREVCYREAWVTDSEGELVWGLRKCKCPTTNEEWSDKVIFNLKGDK